MENKLTRGRKPLPEAERKRTISIFVKNKYAPQAYLEAKRIEKKYNEKTETTRLSEPMA